MTAPRILALDASTTAVGWAVAHGGEYHESGAWKPSPGEWWERVSAFDDWLYGIGCAYEPAVIVFELATGNRGNMHTHRLLGAVEYIIRNCTKYTRGGKMVVMAVTASQVKATGCHKGALAVASAIAGKDVTSGDEADAIGVWLAGWAKIQQESEA